MQLLKYKDIGSYISLVLISMCFILLLNHSAFGADKNQKQRIAYSSKLVKIKLSTKVFTAKNEMISLLDNQYANIIPSYQTDLSNQTRESKVWATLYLDYQIINKNNDDSLPRYNLLENLTNTKLTAMYSNNVLNDKRRVLVGNITPAVLGSDNSISGFSTFVIESDYVMASQDVIREQDTSDTSNVSTPTIIDLYNRISMLQYMNLEAQNNNKEFIGLLEIFDTDTNVISYIALPGDQKAFLKSLTTKN